MRVTSQSPVGYANVMDATFREVRGKRVVKFF